MSEIAGWTVTNSASEVSSTTEVITFWHYTNLFIIVIIIIIIIFIFFVNFAGYKLSSVGL